MKRRDSKVQNTGHLRESREQLQKFRTDRQMELGASIILFELMSIESCGQRQRSGDAGMVLPQRSLFA